MLSKTLAIVASLAALCVISSSAYATTLVTPSGQSVGGEWQAWGSTMQVASVPTLTLLTPADQLCNGYEAARPQGCSISPNMPSGNPGDSTETAASPGPGARFTLYYEEGHQFQWAYVTPGDQAYLESQWTCQLVPVAGGPVVSRPCTDWYWADSDSALDQAFEDGLEGVFPAVYAACAYGENVAGQGFSFAGGTSGSQWTYQGYYLKQVVTPTNTCLYFDQLGRQDGAAPPFIAPIAKIARPTAHRRHRIGRAVHATKVGGIEPTALARQISRLHSQAGRRR